MLSQETMKTTLVNHILLLILLEVLQYLEGHLSVWLSPGPPILSSAPSNNFEPSIHFHEAWYKHRGMKGHHICILSNFT